MGKFFGRQAYLNTGSLYIRDLRMQFTVEKSLVGYPNKANIKIYNLKESSRKVLSEKDTEVLLYAGYDDVVLLFKGNIINAIHRKDQTEWISELYCGDSITALNSSVINKTLPAGSNATTIMNELINSMQGVTKGITEGLTSCINNKRSLLRSLQLSGNVKDFLDKLSKQCGFDYSINDGVLETSETNKPLNDAPIYTITQKNGMIGSPERSDVGVNVKILLKPDLKLGRRIEIKSISETLNVGNLYFRKVPPIKNEGIYRIDKMIHNGDTHDNQWETQISGRVF